MRTDFADQQRDSTEKALADRYTVAEIKSRSTMRLALLLLMILSTATWASGPTREPTADEKAMAALWASMETSEDARFRALAMVAPFNELGGPADLPALVDAWELGKPDADAVVLLASLACGFPPASRLRKVCDDRQLLSRWKQADPANAMPWLIEAERAQSRRDFDALRTALEGVATSTRIEDGYRLTLATLYDALRGDPGFSKMAAGQRAAAVFSMAIAIGQAGESNATKLCPDPSEDPSRIEELGALCRHLAELMFHTVETSASVALAGANIGMRYAADPQARVKQGEELAAIQSLSQRFVKEPMFDVPRDNSEFSPQLAEYLEWVIAQGEVAAMLGWLKRTDSLTAPA